MAFHRSLFQRRVCCFLCFFFSLLLGSCGTKQEPAPKLDYAKGAVTVQYQADKQLNFSDQQPHALLLVLYQLSDVNVFNSFVGYREGLVKLLQATSFDSSVTAVHKKYIEPGSSGRMIFDRAGQTQHLGIVAGYYDLIPEKSSHLTALTFDTSRHGWLLTKSTTVNPLHLNLVLGKDGMRLVEDNDDT